MGGMMFQFIFGDTVHLSASEMLLDCHVDSEWTWAGTPPVEKKSSTKSEKH